MKISYDKDYNIFWIELPAKTFRTYPNISLWYLEEMEPPCNDFTFIKTFDSLEEVLEFLFEKEENSNE